MNLYNNKKSLPKNIVCSIFRKLYISFSQKYFFRPEKKLGKFSIHYIDVKFPEESIFRIFREFKLCVVPKFAFEVKVNFAVILTISGPISG